MQAAGTLASIATDRLAIRAMLPSAGNCLPRCLGFHAQCFSDAKVHTPSETASASHASWPGLLRVGSSIDKDFETLSKQGCHPVCRRANLQQGTRCLFVSWDTIARDLGVPVAHCENTEAPIDLIHQAMDIFCAEERRFLPGECL